jgi:glycosyltransferase involved in cell wall biosynthesis
MTTSVSVALATFNGARYLPAQLASIAAQDRRPDELVVGDDQSSDATPEIVQRFGRDTGIAVRFTRNTERLGSSGNFAAILSRCQGDVILLSDQDDLWAPDRVSVSLQQLQAHPQVGLAFTNGTLINEAGDPIRGSLWQRCFFDRSEQKRFHDRRGWEMLLKTNTVTGATMAIRREALASALPIPPGWVHDGWLAFMIEVMHGALPIDRPLISYRIHAQQQIGIVGLSPRQVMALVRRQDARFYRSEAVNFRNLADRLGALGPIYAEPAEGARGKARFLERRAAGRDRLADCLRGLGRSLVERSYQAYGLGPMQALFDLAGGVDSAVRRRGGQAMGES